MKEQKQMPTAKKFASGDKVIITAAHLGGLRATVLGGEEDGYYSIRIDEHQYGGFVLYLAAEDFQAA